MDDGCLIFIVICGLLCVNILYSIVGKIFRSVITFVVVFSEESFTAKAGVTLESGWHRKQERCSRRRRAAQQAADRGQPGVRCWPFSSRPSARRLCRQLWSARSCAAAMCVCFWSWCQHAVAAFLGCMHVCSLVFRVHTCAARVCAERAMAGCSGWSRRGREKNCGHRGGHAPAKRGAHLYARKTGHRNLQHIVTAKNHGPREPH